MHAAVNTGLWGAGLLLQVALLAVLLVRGGARRLPLFSVLIGFYTLRSAVVFAVSGHVSRAVMGPVYDWLSLVDLLLQVMVAAELALLIVRKCGGWALMRAGTVAGVAMIAAGGGWAAGLMWGTRGRVPIDRGQMAVAIVFVLLFLWAARVRLAGVARRVVEGFAAYGAASAVAQVERYRAAMARDSGRLIGWSYAQTAVYLLVVVFWLAAVWRAGPSGERGSGDGGVRDARWSGAERLESKRG